MIDSVLTFAGGLLKILGSLAVFLYGMKIMSDGIQKTAGENLHKILNMMTSNRVMAVLTGILITAIIQSSSATTVMVVSFVNASLLKLAQAIGVIMGANIGTTVTGWIVAVFGFKFKIAVITLPCIGIGFPFLFSKKPNRKYIGEILIGFGLLFLGLTFLKDSVPNIKETVKESVGQVDHKVELTVSDLNNKIQSIEESTISIESSVAEIETPDTDTEAPVSVIKNSVTTLQTTADELKELTKDKVPKVDTEIFDFIKQFTGHGLLSFFIFVIVGAILTMIVQSSSAAMAITLTLLSAGWIDFPTAAAIVLGENIGTTITAYLASLGTNVNARRAARAHTLFNIAGVIWMTFAFTFFIQLVDAVVPGTIAEDSPTHLAMFHTLFNIINTVIFIFFIPQLAKLVETLVKPRATDEKKGYQLQYISSGLQDTPEINIMNAQKETTRMMEIVEKMFADFLKLFNNPDKDMGSYVEESKDLEELTDTMQVQISKYLSECAKENLNDVSANNVSAMIRIIDEIESIGDSCFNLVILTERKYNKGIRFTDAAEVEINSYYKEVQTFLEFITNHLNEHLHKTELKTAFDLEQKINDTRNTLKKVARKRLQAGSDVNAELLFLDFIKHLERIGDYSLNISQLLREIH